jgi:hypothetical protein
MTDLPSLASGDSPGPRVSGPGIFVEGCGSQRPPVP